MHPHQQLAEILDCARICVERAHVMLNLIANFAELTIAEQAQLLSMISERGGRSITSDRARQLLEQCPCKDLGFCLQHDSAWVLAVGDLSVFEWMPDILHSITGDAPAEPDPEEIAQVSAQMQQEAVEKEADSVGSEPKISPNFETPQPSKKSTEHVSWDVIFRGYDPATGRHQYLLIRAGDEVWSRGQSAFAGGLTPLHDRLQRYSTWSSVHKPLEHSCRHFSTPECSEEVSLVGDLLRRHPELDTVYLIAAEHWLPNPCTEIESLTAEECSAESHRRLTHLGTGLRQESRVALHWPAGLSIGSGLPLSDWREGRARLRAGVQHAAGWRWSVRRIQGERELPVRLTLGHQTSQSIQAMAAFTSELAGECAISAVECEVPFGPQVGPASGGMIIDDGTTAIDCSAGSLRSQAHHRQTLSRTPPIELQRDQEERTELSAEEGLVQYTSHRLLESTSSVHRTDTLPPCNATSQTLQGSSASMTLYIGWETDGIICELFPVEGLGEVLSHTANEDICGEVTVSVDLRSTRSRHGRLACSKSNRRWELGFIERVSTTKASREHHISTEQSIDWRSTLDVITGQHTLILQQVSVGVTSILEQ